MPLHLPTITYVCLKRVTTVHGSDMSQNGKLQDHQIHYNSTATNICFYYGKNANIQNTY